MLLRDVVDLLWKDAHGRALEAFRDADTGRYQLIDRLDRLKHSDNFPLRILKAGSRRVKFVVLCAWSVDGFGAARF